MWIHIGDRNESLQKHRSLAVELLTFSCPVTESKDLSGGHKGEVKRVEEKHSVSSFEVREADVLELAIWHNGRGFELGGRVPSFDFS